MSTEKLTAEQIWEDAQTWFFPTEHGRILAAMEKFANQQVEQQTKQLKEERDELMKDVNTAFELLNHVHTFYTLAEPLEKEVSNFINQLNRNNEQ